MSPTFQSGDLVTIDDEGTTGFVDHVSVDGRVFVKPDTQHAGPGLYFDTSDLALVEPPCLRCDGKGCTLCGGTGIEQ